MTITGGCLCGQVRYTIEGEPKAVGKCYCTDCRRETGTGHMTFASFPADAIMLEGEAKTYTKPGSSGQDVTRLFCPSCGTTVIGYPKALGPVGVVRLGTIDDSSALTATFAVFCSRASGWDQPPAGIKTFATIP